MKLAKLEQLWGRVRDSLWFVPAMLTAAGAGLAAVTLYIDGNVLEQPPRHPWLFVGGAEGALSILGAIVTSLITVSGVTFSVTVVALQLASAQYTPRVLRNFMADHSNQLVLGVFIATFTYALLIQRRVRVGDGDVAAFVPSLSVTVAVLLVLVSVGFLIYFVDHIARSIHASMIIDRATKEALVIIDRMFPEPVGEPAPDELPWTPEAEPVRVHAEQSGYLQAIDEHALFGLAKRAALTIRMEARIGEFIIGGATLASVWPRSAGDVLANKIHSAFLFGPERSPQQDAELGMIELVEIAMKALSPSLNDPETAKNCIDRLGEVLAVLGGRTFPSLVRTDGDGGIRFIARRPTYADLVTRTIEPLRHFGTAIPGVAARLIETLGKVLAVIPHERQVAVAGELDLVLASARARLTQPGELEVVERAAATARNALVADLQESGPRRA